MIQPVGGGGREVMEDKEDCTSFTTFMRIVQLHLLEQIIIFCFVLEQAKKDGAEGDASLSLATTSHAKERPSPQFLSLQGFKWRFVLTNMHFKLEEEKTSWGYRWPRQ